VMGDFSQAMVGFWGNGLEITVGEDQDDFSKALTSVRGIRHLRRGRARSQELRCHPGHHHLIGDEGRATAPLFSMKVLISSDCAAQGSFP